MGKFVGVVLALAVVFFGSLGQYVCGRIILPSMGLTAPEYWTWFFFMSFAMIFCAPLVLIKEILKEL